MESLTAVFGMRTGVPSPLKHQLKAFNNYLIFKFNRCILTDAVHLVDIFFQDFRKYQARSGEMGPSPFLVVPTLKQQD